MPVSKMRKRVRPRVKPVKTNRMNHKNVLLVQFHDVKGDGQLKEMVEGSDGKVMSLTGYRIHSIHDSKSRLLTHYDASKDKTDLSCLKGKDNWFLACVAKTEYGTFVWKCFRIGKGFGPSEIYSIRDGRECTEEECAILNELYPEFLANAF